MMFWPLFAHARPPSVTLTDQGDSDPAGRCLPFLPLSFSFRPVPPVSRKLRLPDRRLRTSVSESWASFIRKNSRLPRFRAKHRCGAGGEKFVLEQSSGMNTAIVRASGNNIVLEWELQTVHTSSLLADAGTIQDICSRFPVRSHATTAAPSRFGQSAGHLLAMVRQWHRETAVASIVAAESTADTPFEALKAQAVATRSYLIASRGRHRDFDFCDTTHCQFLREPPVTEYSCSRQPLRRPRDGLSPTNPSSSPRRTPGVAQDARGLPARIRSTQRPLIPYYSVEWTYCRIHPGPLVEPNL